MSKYLAMLKNLDTTVDKNSLLYEGPAPTAGEMPLTTRSLNSDTKVPLTEGQKISAFMAPCEPLREDRKFLQRLRPGNEKSQKVVMETYKAEWLAGMDSEPVEHKKQNMGRRRANTWLRLNYG